ncbi:MAG: S8 family serine peptidase [Lachnospiraceae bacterium]|nr:S8 family serine peptidase [Lachnospiraceae bacterium]
MKMKKYEEKRRQIAGAMALIMVMSSLMGNMACLPVLAAEGEYPYMMFASSGGEGAITLTTNNVGINGNVATNGSIVTSSQNVNINGTRTENLGNPEAYIGMPDIGEALEAAYFSANTDVLSEDYSLEDTNININTPLEGEGSIELTGNITLNAGVMAEEDLVFSGEVKNTGDVVIYSATGDVVIESTNVNVNGLIYAPHGEIRINSMNLNMNNVILIAEKITIEANGINGGKNQAMAAFIGEDYAVIGDESGDDAGAGDDPSVSDNEGEGGEPSVSENEGNVSDNDISDNNVSDNTVSDNDIMEGIVYLESSFDGGYEGQIYYKEITSEDDIVIAANGLQCVRNQMILSAGADISFETVEASLTEYEALIVGYIEATNDYQIEFIYDKNAEEMELLIQALVQESWVSSVGYNYIWLEEPEFTSSDPWEETTPTEWDSNRPEDSNWGIEAIRLEEALYAAGVLRDTANGTTVDISGLTPVRLGVIDNAFNIWHEDLADNFVADWNNYLSLSDLENAQQNNHRLDHGTHVAGTMAAGFNNGIGITGVCVENEILGFSLDGGTSVELSNLQEKYKNINSSTFKILCALGVLICNNVKVINYSYGMPVVGFLHSQKANECPINSDNLTEDWRLINACNYLEIQSNCITDYLDKLLENGYDFLIVCAAGNTNGDSFYRCSEDVSSFGYITVGKYNEFNIAHLINVDTSTVYTAASMNMVVQARYNSVFNNIESDLECYNHIICVGALDYPTGYPRGDVSYRITNFSCVGDRVDILAPGVDIYSCGVSENYVYKGGTSMATPHVSGALGLALNVNPNISMAQLKQLLIASATEEGVGYPVLNVENLVRAVQDHAVVQVNLTDISGNNILPQHVEVHKAGSYIHNYFGASMDADSIDNIIIDCAVSIAPDGTITAVLPRGHYYMLVTDALDKNGGVIEINVGYDDVGTICEYTEIATSFETEEAGRVRFQVRSSQSGRILGNVNVEIRDGFDNRYGEHVATLELDEFYRFTIDLLNIDLPYGAYTIIVTDDAGNETQTNLIVDDAFVYNVIYHAQ